MNIRVSFVCAIALSMALSAAAQFNSPGNGTQGNNQNLAGFGSVGNGNNSHQPPPPPGQTDFVLQNLLGPCEVEDPITHKKLNAYRPMTLNIDWVTVREVLVRNGVDLNADIIVQTVTAYKETPLIKCITHRVGRGAGKDGINNFFKKQVFATNQNMDDSILALVFGRKNYDEYLGDRALLYSTPGTQYCLQVTYVYRLANGRVTAPETRGMRWTMRTPTLQDIKNYIDFFVPIAAGVTQKPKITWDVAETLYGILDMPVDDLTKMIQFEAAIALSAVDFSYLADVPDARFQFTYLIDSDEEPIGCVLLEQALSVLFHP